MVLDAENRPHTVVWPDACCPYNPSGLLEPRARRLHWGRHVCWPPHNGLTGRAPADACPWAAERPDDEVCADDPPALCATDRVRYLVGAVSPLLMVADAAAYELDALAEDVARSGSGPSAHLDRLRADLRATVDAARIAVEVSRV